MMKLKDQNWIDDVIKQHKKRNLILTFAVLLLIELEEIKKSRTIEEENEGGLENVKSSLEIGNPLNNLNYEEEVLIMI